MTEGDGLFRREFLELTGATGLAALADPATAQISAEEVDTDVAEYGLLLGAEGQRPPQSELDQRFDTYHFVYKATDSGTEYEIRHTDNGWEVLPMSLAKYEDAFGVPVIRNESNDGDLAAHYPYSPQRWRYYVDGSRQFIQYASDLLNPSGIPYQFQRDSHLLSVPAGSTINFKTAETWRYVVQYVKSVSNALQTTRNLASGEYLMAGPYFGVDSNYQPDYGNYGAAAEGSVGTYTDGWAAKFSADIAADGSQVEILEARDGTVVDSYVRETEALLTDWSRYDHNYNWYNVGVHTLEQTTTDEETDGTNVQNNDQLGATSNVDDRGPLVGNKPFMLEAKAGTSSLDIEMGSVGVLTKGAVEPKVRGKTATLNADIESGTDWEPAAALRLAPVYYHADVQIRDMIVFESAGSAELKLQAVDPSKVRDGTGSTLTDSDFSAANLGLSEADNALQATGPNVVEQAPDQSGTVTDSGITNPGGYQIAVETTADKNAKVSNTQTEEQKRALYGSDYAVLYIKGSSGSYRLNLPTVQDF